MKIKSKQLRKSFMYVIVTSFGELAEENRQLRVKVDNLEQRIEWLQKYVLFGPAIAGDKPEDGT